MSKPSARAHFQGDRVITFLTGLAWIFGTGSLLVGVSSRGLPRAYDLPGEWMGDTLDVAVLATSVLVVALAAFAYTALMLRTGSQFDPRARRHLHAV